MYILTYLCILQLTTFNAWAAILFPAIPSITVLSDRYCVQSVAWYSCDEVMNWEDANRTCEENELWSGEQPTCISMLISYCIHCYIIYVTI